LGDRDPRPLADSAPLLGGGRASGGVVTSRRVDSDGACCGLMVLPRIGCVPMVGHVEGSVNPVTSLAGWRPAGVLSARR
jgi:hypothetical protein